MRDEQEIRKAIEELEAKCGEYDAALGNRIRALKWAVGDDYRDIT